MRPRCRARFRREELRRRMCLGAFTNVALVESCRAAGSGPVRHCVRPVLVRLTVRVCSCAPCWCGWRELLRLARVRRVLCAYACICWRYSGCAPRSVHPTLPSTRALPHPPPAPAQPIAQRQNKAAGTLPRSLALAPSPSSTHGSVDRTPSLLVIRVGAVVLD